MKRTQARLAVVAVVLLSVAAVWFALWNRPQPQSEIIPTVEVAVTDQTVPVTSVTSAPLSVAAITPLAFRKVEVLPSGDVPEACFVFSAPLDTAVADWSSFVTLPKGQKASYRLDDGDHRLCLGGLRFGADIPVTLRQGLPAAERPALAADVVTVVVLGDRAPVVEFGPGLFLPRESGAVVPVTTVNVKNLDITLYRAGERVLSQLYDGVMNERSFNIFDPASLKSRYGEKIWSGQQAIEGQANVAMVSPLNIGEGLKGHPPGIYLLMASPTGSGADKKADASSDSDSDEYGYRSESGQWIIVSDIGLTSFQGENGLTVVARSFKTAQVLNGVEVRLLARSNEVLGVQQTNSQGAVQFSAGLMRGEGGNQPILVVAQQKDGTDLTLMDLRRAGFDLSDRGVAGRPNSSAVDPYLYTDRGIYRPGETVQFVALMRSADVNALPDRGATLRLYRPNGDVYRDYPLVDNSKSGALSQSVVLPKSAARGVWRLALRSGSTTLGSLTVDVQDFVPQLLGLSFGSLPEFVMPEQDVKVPLDVRFLYGAVAAGLGGDVTLKIEPDPTPFPHYKEFRWGSLHSRFESIREEDTIAETDAQGHTEVAVKIPALSDLDRPVQAVIRAAIAEPGGRATWEEIHLPIRSADVSIGVRSLSGSSISEATEANFELVTLDRLGKPVAQQDLSWSLVRSSRSWQWFQRGGSWSYEKIGREDILATGQISTRAEDGMAQLRIPARMLTWGEYELRVSAAQAMTAEIGLDVGWFQSEDGQGDRPDRLTVATDRAGYNPGDVAKLHLDTDFDGQGQVVIASNRVHSVQNFAIHKGGTTLEIPVGNDWGAGAYALISSYRPLDGQLGRAPVRSIGVVWLGLAPEPRTLTVALDTPETILPRQTLMVPVTVTAERPLQKAYVTLAAVDQGILQLTRFATPDPAAYYLKQRGLGVTMRDDYGRLIRNDLMGLEGQGGDGGPELGGKGLDVVPTRTVALFSGLVALDSDGKAQIPLEIPDFQGELRLMAVAYDASGVGSIGKPLTVRDPVVAELLLPRYLSPADRAFATLVVHNVNGATGDYQINVRGDAVIAAQFARTEPLAKGQKFVHLVPISGEDTGIADLTLTVKGPEFAVTRSWQMQVRPWQLPISVQETKPLPADGSLHLALPTTEMVKGSISASVNLSRWAGMDVSSILMALDRYPFGCLEQTTSRALPLLYFNDIAGILDRKKDSAVPERIQAAIDRVLSMQLNDGSFSLWPGYLSGDAAPWVSVYAMDFLLRAAGKGYDVPDAPLRLGQKFLENQSGSSSNTGAYAQWLLARMGAGDVASLRYALSKSEQRPLLSEAFLAAALDALGDRGLAGQRWAEVMDRLKRDENTGSSKNSSYTYSSELRNLYVIASLLADVGRSEQIPEILNRAAQFNQTPTATNTQEKGWMILTAAGLAQQAGPVQVTVDGAILSGRQDPLTQSVTPEQVEAGVSLKNQSKTNLFATLAVDGVPVAPLPAEEHSLRVQKTIWSLDGKTLLPLPLSLSRNQRVLVVIEGELIKKDDGEVAVLDLLPAGLEIEGVLRPNSAGYSALELTRTVVQEARDDRYVGVVNLPQNEVYVSEEEGYEYCGSRCKKPWGFRLAYVARAVTPGQFTVPAVKAEAMYTPALWGRSDVQSLTITEDQP